MNAIVAWLIEKVVIRRAAVWLSAMIVGWASNHWWAQSALIGMDIDPNDQAGMTVALVVLLGVLLGAAGEWLAWVKRRHQEGKDAGFGALVDAAAASGKLSEVFNAVEPKARAAMLKTLDDYTRRKAKEVALKEAGSREQGAGSGERGAGSREQGAGSVKGAGCGLIGLMLLGALAGAAEAERMPEAAVTVNSNTVAAIVKNWKEIETPGQFFGAVKDNLEIQGVWAVGYGPKNGLQSGFGAAADLTVWRVELEAIYINIGPGYVLATSHDSQLIHGIELAANAHFIAFKMDAIWKQLPLLGAVPISWDAATLHAGIGATIIGPSSWQPIGVLASVGVGGIKWGK